ncbi:MAG: sn-glycerol-3-phosphate ABC transporter permease UgpE [SAR324 cluster bacterium]|nr:sn-glycerol-3-phosphate ABC transporter permease UgpE [SAR324 cluster bacterium]MCZ6627826.1 sn-glycerol-3-phosphate ABC transporter permease UgpE [SAR324 cluster bacterium]MCZ6647302.1 sn-glycerol-3-phosphate ABC transporter permease UgpE [SAR324 cluster bacterium]MCZ6842570.1 sn-glycerol-3-phosphate ABC transporter permease UgpE [SAR324 cluster bacterium]
MIDQSPWERIFTHGVLILGCLIVAFPVYVTFVASTHSIEDIIQVPMPLLPGGHLIDNYWTALTSGADSAGNAPVGVMMLNSLIMAVTIAVGKISVSILAAFAIVYFKFPFRMFFFWMIFVTLMLPVEVRIIPTYAVISDLGMLDSYAGLTLPLIASATATFLFRQFFMTVPEELFHAARIDGAGPIRFLCSIIIPMSRTNIAALFVILFIYGWNQYLWPLLITTREDMYTILIGINRMLNVGDDQADWHIIMATSILAMIPPVIVVVSMQKLFIKGMTETEK